MSYIETAADHNFSAFLAGLTPGRVLRDRSAMFSKVERKREKFLVQKSATEREDDRQAEIRLAMELARLMRNRKEEK